MSSPKWSKEPWNRMSSNVYCKTGNIAKFFTPDETVRIVKDGDVHMGHPRFEEGLANAQLASTAPELYDALYEIMCWCESINDEPWSVPADMMLNIQTLLAKARGEEG